MTEPIWFPSKDKGQRSRMGNGTLQCEACWRVIKNPVNAYTILAAPGIGTLLPIASENEPNEGWFAIGPECAREIPPTHKVKGWVIA